MKPQAPLVPLVMDNNSALQQQVNWIDPYSPSPVFLHSHPISSSSPSSITSPYTPYSKLPSIHHLLNPSLWSSFYTLLLYAFVICWIGLLCVSNKEKSWSLCESSSFRLWENSAISKHSCVFTLIVGWIHLIPFRHLMPYLISCLEYKKWVLFLHV
jgi:hypothetical protein